MGWIRERKELTTNKAKYIKDALERYHMESCTLVNTPMEVRSQINTEVENTQEQGSLAMPCKSLVGNLMHTIHPDIALVSSLSHCNTDFETARK